MAFGAPNNDPLIGKLIDDRYEVLAHIGEGGMGVVYKARQVSIDRIVAIKMLNQQMARDPKWVARFNQEAKACSRLQHPNTIRMFEFGQTKQGQLFMAMEFLDGQPLNEAVRTGAPMAPVRVLKILIQCCASLAEAHGYGIVHRDIKPDNVFLLSLAGSPDFVKVLDFGTAKLLQDNDGMRTQAGVVFGTPQYMSPEQGRGAPLDARSDLYALGILGYEMLTGKVPFNDHNPMLVLQMHLREPVPPMPSTIPPPVNEIVMRCLDKNPHRRFQSATEMMQACQQVFTQLGAHAAGVTPPPMSAPGMNPPPGMGHAPQAHHAPPGMNMPPAMSMPPPRAGINPPPGMGGHTPVPEQTVMAPLGGVPGAPPPAAPPGGYAAPPQEKTMMAGMAPNLAAMAPPPAAGFGSAPPPAGAYAAPPQEKTMMAGMAPNLGVPSSAPPQITVPAAHGSPVITVPAARGRGGNDGGSKRTMILDNTEGIVSLDGVQAPTTSAPLSGPSPSDQTSVTNLGGPSPLFWLICLGTGLAIGVLAYIVVLKLGG